MTDPELLSAWTDEASETAFAELVRRHLDFVYGAALRQVREPELARDVSQAVFLILARKAASLGTGVFLPGWLFRTTRFVATRALRTQLRRHRREQESLQMNPAVTPPEIVPEAWKELECHLDAALATLPTGDRDVVLLRYFERQPLHEVGRRLGITEEAAKKRIQRALEKLRRFFGRRGTVLTAAGLLGLLARPPVHAAPPDLAAVICGSAVVPATTAVAALVSGGLRDWFWLSVRNTLPWAVAGLMLLGVGGWQVSRTLPDRRSSDAAASSAGSESPTAPAWVGSAVRETSRLQLDVRSAVSGQPLRASLRVLLLRDGELEREWELASDDAGAAEIPVEMEIADALQVWVSSAGHVPVQASWQGHEFTGPLLIESFRLEPGLALQGTVVNEAGQAVAGAVVQLEGPGPSPGRRQNVAFHPRWNAVTTDAAGQFRSDQLPSLLHHYLTFSVDHPDYVRATFPLEGPDSQATNWVVTLRRGLWARGRVVFGTEGLAVSDASIIAERSPGRGFRQAVADGEGRFRVGPFSAGPLTLTVQPPGLVASKFRIELSPDSKEFVLYLPSDLTAAGTSQSPPAAGPMVRLTGRVTDRESGAPIPRFRICLIEPGSDTRLLGEGVDGRFDWAIRMGLHAAFQLEVAAEDYRTALTEMRPVSEADQEFSVALEPGKGFAGWVVDARGRPVPGAFVGLNHGGNHSPASDGRPGEVETPAHRFAIENSGRLQNANSGFRTLTDRDGWFSLPPTPHAESVLIVAPEGCSQVPVAALENRKISLQAWGAIEGTWVQDGRPAVDQTLMLRDWIPEDARIPLGIGLNMHVRTDATGRFQFPRVPAGTVELLRVSGLLNREDYSLPTRVTVAAGAMTEVHLENDGRPVVGRLRAPDTLTDHRWEMDEVVLMREVPEEPPDDSRAIAIWTQEMPMARCTSAVMGPEGTFRFASVAGGRYRLEAWLRAPLESESEPGRYRILGHLAVPLTLPEVTGEESEESPLDLGVLEVPLNGAPQPPR